MPISMYKEIAACVDPDGIRRDSRWRFVVGPRRRERRRRALGDEFRMHYFTMGAEAPASLRET